MSKRKKATIIAANPQTQCKDSDQNAQYQITYQSFKEYPKTMLDVSLETGILRANICRYVADMEDKGLIQLLYKAEDKNTKSVAGYYTTDKELFNLGDNRQLKLWEVE